MAQLRMVLVHKLIWLQKSSTRYCYADQLRWTTFSNCSATRDNSGTSKTITAIDIHSFILSLPPHPSSPSLFATNELQIRRVLRQDLAHTAVPWECRSDSGRSTRQSSFFACDWLTKILGGPTVEPSALIGSSRQA